jgi:hypothetical protein
MCCLVNPDKTKTVEQACVLLLRACLQNFVPGMVLIQAQAPDIHKMWDFFGELQKPEL